MGYCTERQYLNFMSKVIPWEQSHIDDGLILIKLYLSISKENQEIYTELIPIRFAKRHYFFPVKMTEEEIVFAVTDVWPTVAYEDAANKLNRTFVSVIPS